jgi:hypothetical protein
MPGDLEKKITVLNDQYFVVTIKGKVRVGKIGLDGLELMTERDFKLREANKQHFVSGPKNGVKLVSLADACLKDPGRRTFDGIDLEPEGKLILPGNRLNIYRGWGVTPKKGSWDRLEDHIYDVLAGGNTDHDDYICWWCAWAVQHPGERAEAALVLKGNKGAGKGVLGNAMCKIFGPHAVHIASEDQLIGRFKGHLENGLFVFSDEAMWGGGKKGIGELQALITESRLYIERKGLDQFEMTNRLKILAASDKEWPVAAGAHERRYVMPVVSDRYCRGVCPDGKREAYFSALHKELYEDGGLEAFMWDLQNGYDLKGWHPRQIVETEELRRQQKLGMKPIAQWWENLLHEGELPRRPGGFETATISVFFADPQKASTAALKESAASFDPKLKELSDQDLATFLKDQQGAIPAKTNAFRGWKMLPLAQHREAWQAKYGPRDWEMNRSDWDRAWQRWQTTFCLPPRLSL